MILHRVTLTFAILLCFVLGGTARASNLVTKPKNHTLMAIFVSQTENLKHSTYVCRYGANDNKLWHCKAKVWLLKEWKKTDAKLHPNIQNYVKTHHPCLDGIIALENKAYDPTLDFGGGHGNVDEPYGIPQANPGTKMASAGKDWATNAFTQIKWMIGYVNSRYGGECQALAFRIANRSY